LILNVENNVTKTFPQNAGLPNYLVMTVKAKDDDSGDNGRISYHFKARGGALIQETDEFVINAETGELRTKVILDRELKPKYEVIIYHCEIKFVYFIYFAACLGS
jgi:hypothetical protein